MIYNLNDLEKTIKIWGKTFFIWEISESLKKQISEMWNIWVEDKWRAIIDKQLKFYNDDYEEKNGLITEWEILIFIRKIKW